MTISSKSFLRSVATLTLSVGWLVLASPLFAHPLPDIPVRSHFDSKGNLEIRVEIDPRSFEDDPEQFEYTTKTEVASISEQKFTELSNRASQLVQERLAFHFEPLRELKPSFQWQWTGFGDKPAAADDKEAPMVLVGSWKTTIPSGINGYHLTSKQLDPFKMGIPLNVVFLNFIDGVQAERYAVLFPGETSYTLDLTAL